MTKRDNRRRTGRRQVEFEENVDLLDIGSDDDPGGDDLLEFEGSSRQRAIIKVVGVGGGGGNALRTMIQSGLSGVEFIAANTDAQALQYNEAPIKVQLGRATPTQVIRVPLPRRNAWAGLHDRIGRIAGIIR